MYSSFSKNWDESDLLRFSFFFLQLRKTLGRKQKLIRFSLNITRKTIYQITTFFLAFACLNIFIKNTRFTSEENQHRYRLSMITYTKLDSGQSSMIDFN